MAAVLTPQTLSNDDNELLKRCRRLVDFIGTGAERLSVIDLATVKLLEQRYRPLMAKESLAIFFEKLADCLAVDLPSKTALVEYFNVLQVHLYDECLPAYLEWFIVNWRWNKYPRCADIIQAADECSEHDKWRTIYGLLTAAVWADQLLERHGKVPAPSDDVILSLSDARKLRHLVQPSPRRLLS